jgi:acetyl esterase/lipase
VSSSDESFGNEADKQGEFHPDLRRSATLLPRRTFTPRTLWLLRTFVALRGRGGPRDVDVVPLGAGAAVRVHRPVGATSPLPALLWIHGGCYVVGSASQDDKLCHRFARTLGIMVASVEYRVAPEHPYPAALDDCTTALNWLAKQPEVDSSRIAIGGGSAGGGLAAALALPMRDLGTTQPAMQLLTYPMLDDRPAFRPDPNPQRRRFMDQGMNRFGWQNYLRGLARPEEAVPTRAKDLTGLPPAWIGVGTMDLLFDESLEYAERLRRQGVLCELEIVPGAFHGFDLFAPNAGVSRHFFESQCAALRKQLTPP